MNEQTTKLIQQLADKLGTTAEHLWAVLVKQAPITSSIELVALALAAMLWVFFLRLFRKYCRTHERELDEPHVCFGWLGIVGYAAIWLGIIGCSMPTIIAGFCNPEYWALMQVMPGK